MTERGVLRGARGRIMAAIMAGIIPRGGAFSVGAADYDLLPMAETFIRSMNPAFRFGFPFLLFYIQIAAMFRYGRPLTKCTEEEASSFLKRFETSRFFYKRMIILALKMITFVSFYDIDENAALIGYHHLKHVRGEGRLAIIRMSREEYEI